jgi:hypothetical protein
MYALRGVTSIAALAAIAALRYAALASEPIAPQLDTVALIERLSGEATVTRGPATAPARQGDPLQRGDRISTGPGARLSSVFNDGSRFQLGENAVLIVRDFVVERGRKTGAILLDLVAGPIRLTTSSPVTAPGKRVEIKTSAASIVASASDVWSGEVDGARGVLLMAGKAHVRNDAGSVLMERRKAGTHVTDRHSPPDPAAGWARDKIGLALASVTVP